MLDLPCYIRLSGGAISRSFRKQTALNSTKGHLKSSRMSYCIARLEDSLESQTYGSRDLISERDRCLFSVHRGTHTARSWLFATFTQYPSCRHSLSRPSHVSQTPLGKFAFDAVQRNRLSSTWTFLSSRRNWSNWRVILFNLSTLSWRKSSGSSPEPMYMRNGQ